MRDMILEALAHIPASNLDYQDWLSIGMALKSEGYDVTIFDDWSRSDTKRYSEGKCLEKWKTFSDGGVTGATIMYWAKHFGFVPHSYEGDGDIPFDGEIEYDGLDYVIPSKPEPKPADQLITYLKILYREDEYVGYVTTDVWVNKEGKFCPGKGNYDRTAGQLISLLENNKDDIGAVIGDIKPECGAWIRFNPVDGKGVKNENVTRFTYALVESDSLPISEQEDLYRKLQLPIACLVKSGGKSLHAIVKVEAVNEDEYKRRVLFLYETLDKNGLIVDRNNKNPSRLSRMPGIMRNGVMQELVDTNIGKKSWSEWLDFVDELNDDLPNPKTLSSVLENPPPLADEIIYKILRKGHKMLLSGSSKAGKSFLLMELAIAISEGRDWLSFKTRKGKVFYVNLEIDEASCINRFAQIYKAMKITPEHADDIMVWTLRGKALTLDKLYKKIIRRVKDGGFDVIILDPIYKVITGDENSASDMGAFCNLFDRIATETGCAMIYCHHHSKGAQGFKKAMDRASGSGVFARDPDAQLDMIQLDLTDEFILKNADDPFATGWRLEGSLREFPNFKPVNFWFQYPIHVPDKGGLLEKEYAEGDTRLNLKKSGKLKKSAEELLTEFEEGFNELSMGESCVDEAELREYLEISERALRDRVSASKGKYFRKKGKVYKNEE